MYVRNDKHTKRYHLGMQVYMCSCVGSRVSKQCKLCFLKSEFLKKFLDKKDSVVCKSAIRAKRAFSFWAEKQHSKHFTKLDWGCYLLLVVMQLHD